MDLSKLSDEDLKALHEGDVSKLSNDALMSLHGQVAETPQAQTSSYSAPGAVNQPSGAVSPDQQQAADDQTRALTIPNALAAGGQMVANAAEQHPYVASALGAGALGTAFPAVAHRIPGVGQAMDLAQGGISALRDYNLNQAEHQAVQYMKAGQTPPPEFQARLNALRQAALSKMPGAAPATPPVGGPAAQQGANFLENMIGKFGSLAQRYAPVLNNPIINNPVSRGVVGTGAKVLGNPYVQGLTYSPEVNVNEQAELERRRRMAPTIR